MRIIIYLSLLPILISCDPEVCTTHYLINKTNEELNIDFFIDNYSSSLKYTIMPSNNMTKISTGCIKGGILEISFILYDSIVVYKDNTSVIVYTENKSGKNIYSYDYWIRNKTGKRNYEYIFEITEEDLPNPGGG